MFLFDFEVFFCILAYYCVLKYDLNDNIMNVMMCKEIKKSLYGDKKAPSLFSSFGHILLLGAEEQEAAAQRLSLQTAEGAGQPRKAITVKNY